MRTFGIFFFLYYSELLVWQNENVLFATVEQIFQCLDMVSGQKFHRTSKKHCRFYLRTSHTETAFPYKFYRFPLRERDRLKRWLENIGRPWWLPSSYDRICSLHFERHFLINRLNQTMVLRENAVPTIFNTAATNLINDLDPLQYQIP